MRIYISGCQNPFSLFFFFHDAHFEHGTPSEPLELGPWCPPAQHLVKGVLSGLHHANDVTAGLSPSRQAENRCHSAQGYTAMVSRDLGRFESDGQVPATQRDALMQKSFGVLGIHMVLWYMISGREWELVLGARWAYWHSMHLSTPGLPNTKPFIKRETRVKLFLKKNKLSEKTKGKTLWWTKWCRLGIHTLITSHISSSFVSKSAQNHFRTEKSKL